MPTITGKWRRGEVPVRGSWRLSVPARVTDLADNAEILPEGLYANGDLSVDVSGPSLLLTDFPSSAGTLPPAWKPVLIVQPANGREEVYVLDVSGDGIIDLETIVLPQELPDEAATLTLEQFAGALAPFIDAGSGDVTWADVDGKPTTFPPSAHQHAWGDITTGKPTSFAPSAHKSTHATGGTDALSPADIGAATAAAVQAISDLATAHAARTDNPHAVTKAQVGLGNVNNTADTAKPVSTAQQAALDGKADLVGGVVPTSQLPAQRTFDLYPVVSQAAMLALSQADVGDVAIRSDFTPARRYQLLTTPASTLGNWQLISVDPNANVDSVNSQTGVVVLGPGDVNALSAAGNLSDLPSPATARGNLGLGGSATRAVGTAAGTVAAGDDSRITGAAQKASNLSDLGSASTARTNLGLGTAAEKNTGTASGDVAVLGTGGRFAPARLGSGTADATTFLRGDGAFASPAPASEALLSGETSIDEFEGDTLDVAWTRVDAPGGTARATWQQKRGRLSVANAGGDASNELHAMVRPLATALAAGDAISTKMTILGPTTSNYAMAGIVLADGNTYGSGVQLVDLEYLPGINTSIRGWTGYNAQATTNGDSAIGANGIEFWTRLVLVAANTWRIDHSPDGVSWAAIGTTVSKTFTPTHVGLYSSSFGSATKSSASYSLIRRQSGVS